MKDKEYYKIEKELNHLINLVTKNKAVLGQDEYRRFKDKLFSARAILQKNYINFVYDWKE